RMRQGRRGARSDPGQPHRADADGKDRRWMHPGPLRRGLRSERGNADGPEQENEDRRPRVRHSAGHEQKDTGRGEEPCWDAAAGPDVPRSRVHGFTVNDTAAMIRGFYGKWFDATNSACSTW